MCHLSKTILHTNVGAVDCRTGRKRLRLIVKLGNKEQLNGVIFGRSLRSSSELILDVSKYKLKAYGSNAFSVAASTLWNKLPNQIKISKPLSA